MSNTPQKILALIGHIKTFGAFGEKYEVLSSVRSLKNGDWLMKIKILQSGEEVMYRYSEIVCDPMAI